MTMSRRIWHILHVAILALLILSGRIVYWQLVRADELRPVVLDPVVAATQYRGGPVDPAEQVSLDMLPQPVIQRTQAFLARIQRGNIYDRNGSLLAYNEVDADGNTVRVYPEPAAAHVVGYISGLRTGVAGIERTFNDTLLGLNRFDTQVNETLHRPMVGSDVHLTLDSRIQQAAAQVMGDRAGAVVVLDPHTGAVLAMVSSPSYDPNRILDPAYVQGLLAACADPINCQSALFNRAAQGMYVPGSTWKTVTLVAALDTGQANPTTSFDVGPPRQDEIGQYYVYMVDGGAVVDRNHREQVLDLTQAYVASANAVFGRLGDEMGAETLLEYARRLGFGRGEAPPLEIPTSAPQVANDPQALYTNNLLRAYTAIGQGEILTSPLSMALVYAAVVNNGDVPWPHLIQSVRHPNGLPLRGEPGGTWLRDTMRPETARQAREMMVALVKQTHLDAVMPGIVAGGKTGTAEVGQGQGTHAWFVGFAEANNQSVVVAVVVEHGGGGGTVAMPIFAEVAREALRLLNEPVELVSPAGG